MKSYFPRLLNKILVLKEKQQWEKKDIKIGLLSSRSGMIPICLSPEDPSASLDQNGICLQAVPLSKGWVFPTVPLQSLPVSQEDPRQRPNSFCWLTQPQKEKRNTYLWDYLESRVSLWKRELCMPQRDETCDTRKWFDAATLSWGGRYFSMLQICEDGG